jgi:hypothetical protein
MTADEHLTSIGKIVGNLWSLELLLRIFLAEANHEQTAFPTSNGEMMQETRLTNYATLDELISEYNDALAQSEQQYRVDATVVKLRNAFAHGRASSTAAAFPLTLWKSSKANQNKQVKVEFLAVLNDKWFEDNRRLTGGQISNVVECAKARKYKTIGGT